MLLLIAEAAVAVVCSGTSGDVVCDVGYCYVERNIHGGWDRGCEIEGRWAAMCRSEASLVPAVGSSGELPAAALWCCGVDACNDAVVPPVEQQFPQASSTIPCIMACSGTDCEDVYNSKRSCSGVCTVQRFGINASWLHSCADNPSFTCDHSTASVATADGTLLTQPIAGVLLWCCDEPLCNVLPAEWNPLAVTPLEAVAPSEMGVCISMPLALSAWLLAFPFL
ncbi:hypothetical protein DIPPA_53220 [Diplonema papillatum]|nr:hypothetical protein DIPPA_53220 [Diplonema papillatum]